LRANARGYHLEADDGAIWQISGAEPFAALTDHGIVIEAWRGKAGQLDLLWAGPAA
jgi:hypothetical protein